MIASSLKYLAREITAHYNDIFPLDPKPEFVVLDNIAPADSNVPQNKNVLLTLVNIEEEKTLKNGPTYAQNNGTLSKKNPTIYLNLYLLFSCADDYEMALHKISCLISVLQSKQVFTPENAHPSAPFPVNVEKIILDLYSLNFEQLNHLWGILGGKYQPSVMYKSRLIAIQASDLGPVATIEEIATNN